jgi:hypothetical protein
VRLSVEDHAAYLAKVTESGQTKSAFFRDCVLKNRTQVVARPTRSIESKRVLFVVNKAGNNLNQLAHRANSDHAVGKISEATYADILYQLQRISQYLKATARHAD